MAHITLSQLTTVLQRIVSWATGKFAAKNTYSGKIEYTDMPVVVLASMGSELDGTSTQRPMSAGSTYYLPAGQGAGARIMFVDSNGTAVKISNPESNVIYCNAYTGLLYRWDASESDMVPVGGDVDGLRKVYVDNSDFSSLDTLYSGVYQVIDQTTQRIIGVLVASSDGRIGVNPYFVTQWLFSNLLLSDEYSGSFNGYYTIARAHIIHRFYNASNTSYSDIPLNTWSEWKVYGLTLDEMSEIFNSKVSSISVNGVNHTPDSSGVIDLGTVITSHQDISGKANASDVYSKTQTDTLLAGKLSKSDVSVETQGDGTVDINVKDDTYTINLNHTHEDMAKLIVCEESGLPSTLDPATIYAITDNGETEIEKLIIRGMEFAGGSGAAPGVPTLDYPRVSELTIEGDGTTEATSTIKVKAKNITGAVNVAISGTGFSITAKDGVALSTPITSANGPLVISNADALLGVMLTIAYNGADDAEGSLVISSAAATAEFTAKSVDLIADIPMALPAGWQANKAWTASGETMSAPNDLEGFCTTEFFALAHDNSRKFGWICKAGYTCDHDGITGDIPRGLMVMKNALTDTNSNAAYRQKTDPIAYSDTDTTYIYNFISATFKMSELPNCYIYDTIAGRYLWAGSNVDTSVAPNV